MPYIYLYHRADLELKSKIEAQDVGQLNYQITRLLLKYLEMKGLRYDTLNDIVGVLECSKSEFYRRVVMPYEEYKRQENGDIYSSEVCRSPKIRQRAPKLSKRR